LVTLNWNRRKSLWTFGLCICLAFVAVSYSRQPSSPPYTTEVKAVRVIQRDAPVIYNYSGQVKAQKELQLRANVSGNIITKMVTGGGVVKEGQPLFQIDRRQYEAVLRVAQAQLSQAEALARSSHLDVQKYKNLVNKRAISRQILDNAQLTEEQNVAAIAAYQGKVQQAENDLNDTLVVSPFSGYIDVNDLSAGSFVQAGDTILASISSLDPVFVQFGVSEDDYPRFVSLKESAVSELKLYFNDGNLYPLTGKIEQIDRSLAINTGKITIKATFDNSYNQLIPGMSVQVQQAETRKGALLLPQCAVHQIAGKIIVAVIGENNTIELRQVKMGPMSGTLQVVETGVTANDQVVVKGFEKIESGTTVKATMVEPDAL
jgi:membrane fusion protein (multidrug efflux system)